MATSNITSRIFDFHTGQGIPGVKILARLRPVASFRAVDGVELVQQVETVTDASGNYTLTLERTADISPANTHYAVEEQRPESAGGAVVWQIQVGPVNQSLMAARIVASPILLDAAYLTQSVADARYAQLSQLGGAITASAPGDTLNQGAGTGVARDTHRHAREAWGLLADLTALYGGSAAAVGASGRVADAAHRHGQGIRWSGEKRKTTDSLLSTTVWADIDNAALDMTIPAAIGDVIAVYSSVYWSSEVAQGFMDAVFVASGTHFSAGGGTGTGFIGWFGLGSVFSPRFGVVTRTVVVGDISGGNVIVRLRRRNNAASAKTLLGHADYPMIAWAMNLGPAL